MKKALLLFLITVAVLAAGTSLPAEEEKERVPVDVVVMNNRDRHVGRITKITEDGTLFLETDDAEDALELSILRVLNINMNTKDPNLSKYIRRGWVFHTLDGARITGRLLGWADKHVTIDIDYGEDVKIRRDGLWAVSVGNPNFRPAYNEGDKAVLYLKNPDMKIICDLQEIKRGKIAIRDHLEGGKEKEFKIADILGFTLPVGKPGKAGQPAPGWYTRIGMPNRDYVIGTLEKMADNRLCLITQYCGVVEIDRKMAAILSFSEDFAFSNGLTLLTDNRRNRVFAVDLDGNEVWSFSCNQPWNARWLTNGNILITAYGEKRVIEVDMGGKVVWQKTGLSGPASAVRLPDGGTAIAESDARRIIICDPQGGQTKTLLQGIYPRFLDITNDGTLLVTDSQQRRVLEIGTDGKIIWQKKGFPGLRCARALPDGNIAVLEYDGRNACISICNKPNGEIKKFALKYPGPFFTYHFDVLANGNILIFLPIGPDIPLPPISDRKTISIILEINPLTGKTVSEIELKKSTYNNIRSIDRN